MPSIRSAAPSGPNPLLPTLAALGVLYVFLAAIDLMGSAFKLLGASGAQGLFTDLGSPAAGLAVGVLATVLVQSSSMTTSLVVSAVAAGSLPLEVAVFTVMGCNIGTTVTNTLVALGHARQDAEFRRALAGSTVHDFFNVLAVIVFLPLEWTTGFLHHFAQLVSARVSGGAGPGGFVSPVKTAIRVATKPIERFFVDGLDISSTVAGVALVILSLVLVFASLTYITKTMQAVLRAPIERALNRVLRRSGLLAIAFGAVVTMAVQSSSITTSLLIPLFAAGILSLENGFPVTIGANIGTTITALLAAMAAGSEAGLTIALVHVFFNVSAAVLIYPVPAIRRIPIKLSVLLAELTAQNKLWALIYVGVFFVLFPLVVYLIFR